MSPTDVTTMLIRTKAALEKLPERLEQSAGMAIAQGRRRGSSVRLSRTQTGISLMFSGRNARASSKAARRALRSRTTELTQEIRDASRP